MVMKVYGPQFDVAYLRHTADLLDVAALLQRACRDAGLEGEDA